MRGTLLFLLLSCCCQTLYAQKHDYTWIFGYRNGSQDTLLGGATIDFKTDPPRVFKDPKKIDMGFYCGACSDSSGRLAFYTNGISIRDRTHERMLFGDTINPGFYWESWQNRYYPIAPLCFALPDPRRKNHYYLFHLALDLNQHTQALQFSPFYCSLIDMNGNNGLGKVIRKNRVLIDKSNLVPPVAVKHGNGRDWWVITGEVSTAKIYTFLLSPEGVQGPYTHDMPYVFPGTEYSGLNTMSPDGRLYVRCSAYQGLYILNFNRCTGQFFNQRVLPFGSGFSAYSTVFAPDSRHLYFSETDRLMVLDLQAADIGATLDTVAYYDGGFSPFLPFRTGFFIGNLAPDGKIYYATTNSTMSMHYVHRPGWPGVSADVEQHGLALPKFNDGTMCLFPNYRLGEWVDAPCDTLHGQRPGDGFDYTYFTQRDASVAAKPGYQLFPPIGDPAKKDMPRSRRPPIWEEELRPTGPSPSWHRKQK